MRELTSWATNSVVIRVLLSCVGSTFLVVTISLWNSSQSVPGSPYVAVPERLSIPAAAKTMNAVVLVVLWALNSRLYGAGAGGSPSGTER